MSSNTETWRTESDSMGEVRIPGWAYWGAQTQRAVENFGVSDLRIPQPMIRSLALIKKAAAEANGYLKVLDPAVSRAIQDAADEVICGRWDAQFPIDVFQTGSGTSWNMNMNEVLANRAAEILGYPIGKRDPVHPNDHVNRGQSSNDVIPSALHIANRVEAGTLVDALGWLEKAFSNKAREFGTVMKLGRTHLQDAVPMTLGQEFSGFAEQIRKAAVRLENTFPHLEELALGGTAIGTGINCPAGYAEAAIAGIVRETGIPFRGAKNLFEAIAARDAQVELMGALNTLSSSLIKIANDIRLLASGPRGALGEIVLPSLQPGSSIMPGKVNPVIPEMVIQVGAYVCGKVVSVSVGSQNGPLELNMMHPMIAWESISSLTLLSRTCDAFAERCVNGIHADTERCSHWIEWSLALVTPLATELGYDTAAQLAYKAYRENRTIREVVRESGLLSKDRIDTLLDPARMIHPD
jgi:fumarate hydratase, class II